VDDERSVMATRPARDGGGLFIDGRWETPGEELDVTDLADGGTFATVSKATPDEAEAALAAAERAQERIGDATVVERAGWMEEIADGLEARTDELAEIIVREAGKPVSSARGEVGSAAERFRRAAEEIRNRSGEFREGSTAGHEGWRAVVTHEPVGTVLSITPYNYPLSTVALHVAPALAAGNAVIHTPASRTPVSGAVLAEVIGTSGVPSGAYNYLPGESSEIGDVLAGDDRVDAIAMTGSSGAGEHVARQSGMVALHMELGGNAPALVFPDADLDSAAADCAKGSFKYAGQRCSAVSRVLAHETIHDDLVARIEATMDEWATGDLFEEDTAVGPLIDAEQAEYVEELIEDAVERGAELVRGGERDGRTIQPALLADVPHDARVLHEEQFGPIAAVAKVTDEEEALALANAGDLALDGAVFTADHDRAMRVAEALDAGGVRINGAPSHGLGDIPFGGNDASGIGREGLNTTIEAFSTTKSIVL